MASPPDDFEDPLADIDPVMEQAFSVSEDADSDSVEDLDVEAVSPGVPDPESVDADEIDSDIAMDDTELQHEDEDDEEMDSSYEDAVSDFEFEEEEEEEEGEVQEDPSIQPDVPEVLSGASPDMDLSPVQDDEIEETVNEDAFDEPTVYEEEDELDALFQGGAGSVDENPMGFGQDVPDISVEEDVVDRFQDVSPDVPDISQIEFPDLSMHSSIGPKIQEDVFSAIPVSVSVELGRANLSLKEVYELSEGSIIELERLVGEPLDLVVNGQVIAQGEVVAIDNKYGLRIKTIVSAASAVA